MEAAITALNFTGAAAIATADPKFINVTVRQFAAPMSNLEESRRVRLNDFIAMVMGFTRDNLDARALLTDNKQYVVDVANPEIASNTILKPWDPLFPTVHYVSVDQAVIDVQRYLIVRPQEMGATDGATPPNVVITPLGTNASGLLTSHAWTLSHLVAGTNRRAISYAFREFLCTPIESLSDTSALDNRVRRDVDRSPGGVPATYQNTCRGCHAGLDALAGAYAHYDYGNRLVVTAAIRPKYSQNATFSPTYITTDDSWMNLWTQNQNAALGWSATAGLSGNGVKALGNMLANSDAFANCMATRAFREVCGVRTMTPALQTVITSLKNDFKTNGYKLKRLFERTAAHESCLGR